MKAAALFDVDPKYKVKLEGVYNRAVYVCPHCQEDLLFKCDTRWHGFYDLVKGIAEHGWMLFYVIECPLCFGVFFYHAREDGYNLFLRSIEKGFNLHYQEVAS